MDLILLFAAIGITTIANIKVNNSYSKYLKVNNSLGLTGKDVARKILEMHGMNDVVINEVSGKLSDHYNPKNKTVNLSHEVYSNTSIASVAVAAHEVGHSIQHKEQYGFLTFRTALVPVVNITSKLASVMLLLGIILNLFDIYFIGILLLSGGLIFQLITLPVEFDASRRAKNELKKCGLLEKKDTQGVEKMLSAAAFTYVAAFLSTALQILRLVMSSRKRN